LRDASILVGCTQYLELARRDLFDSAGATFLVRVEIFLVWLTLGWEQ
jgi:hypothetical protein